MRSGMRSSPPACQWIDLVMDATRFKTRGGCGDDVRLHQSYDLRTGRMVQVSVTDRHQGESLAHFQLQAGWVI